MTRYLLFLAVAVALMIASIVFFWKTLTLLQERDYVGSILLAFVGFAVIRVGSEAMRLAMVQKE